MPVPVLTENLHAGAFIVSERQGFYSRDAVTVDASATAMAGTVLGQKGIPADETAVAAPVAGNTGNGTLTMDATAPIAASAIDGVYAVMFLTATAFEVQRPNGVIDGAGVVGTAYNHDLKFVLAAGATAFTAGDRFTVTVLQPDVSAQEFAPLNLTATDGTQIATAVLIYPIGSDEVAAGATVQRTVLAREAEVRAVNLTWPAGATTAQIAEATNQLQRPGVGIILR